MGIYIERAKRKRRCHGSSNDCEGIRGGDICIEITSYNAFAESICLVCFRAILDEAEEKANVPKIQV